MIIEVNGEHPQPRRIQEALRSLGRGGGLIAYPTDTVYAVGCRLDDREAVEAIDRLKTERGGSQGPLSVIVPDLSAIASLAVVEDVAYRILRRALPGPFTFVLKATRQVPKFMLRRQKTIGIRMPDAPVAQALCEALGGVLITTSAKSRDGELLDDPREIEAEYRGSVRVVLDAGPILSSPSTVIDLTSEPHEVLRRGKGDPSALGLS